GTGKVQPQGAPTCPNGVLPPWLQGAVRAVRATLPGPPPLVDAAETEVNQARWTRWQEGLRVRITLPADLPRLRVLLVWDNLTGHYTPDLLLWLFAQGVMVLYTPLSGSWLNMAESLHRLPLPPPLSLPHPPTPPP